MKPWDVLGVPSVTYNEDRVRLFVTKFCDSHGIKYWKDPLGDIWLNVQGPSNIKNLNIALVAHMDHPGITMTSKTTGRWNGGMPKNLIGAKVKLFGEDSAEAEIVEVDQKTKTVKLSKKSNARGACLWFDELPNGYKVKDGRIITRAADNLISVATILASLKDRPNSKTGILFTRSEENHLEGVGRIIEAHELNKKTKIIVTDVTRERYNCRQGKGIYIRTKDGAMEYKKSTVNFLESIAKHHEVPYFAGHVDRGRTEGAAFTASGYDVGSVGIVVKNMHNKPDNSEEAPVPEMILATDVLAYKKFIDGLL